MRAIESLCRILFALAVAGGMSACASLGPSRMGVDRDAYLQHLRETDKQQLLANIVGMQQGDAPVFLTVTSVISQYTREGSATANATLAPASDSDGGGLSGSITLRETPTITYTPLSGENLSRSVLSPMSPAALMGMVQSGWAVDTLFLVAVRSINGVRNNADAQLFSQQHDDQFQQVIAALRRLQVSSAMAIRMHQKDHSFTAQARIRPTLNASEHADLAYLRQTLGLEASDGDFRISFGEYAEGAQELAISTRSVFEILSELGTGLTGQGTAVDPPLLVIHQGKRAPAQSYVAINYGGHWYWIDRDDQRSKQNFLIAQVLMYLTQSGQAAGAPLLTVPAG
jgi:hypothetical protein